MSSNGWNLPGDENPNGFNRAPLNNSNSIQEYCEICHQVFDSIEALTNHYDTHHREDEHDDHNMGQENFPEAQAVGQNNYVVVQSQVALQSQRSLAFGLDQNQNLIPQGLPFVRSSYTIIQQRQIQPVAHQVERRQNFAPPNLIRHARAFVAQPNQPAIVPDEIELDFSDEENNNNGSINLNLTLGLN